MGYVQDGLVSYFKCDDPSNPLSDNEPAGNNIVIAGSPTWQQEGKLAYAVRLPDDGATIGQSGPDPTGLMNGDAISIEFTIKMNSWEDSYPNISGVLTMGDSGYTPWIIRFGDAGCSKNKIQFVTITTNGNCVKLCSNFSCLLNTWYHIVCTWDKYGATMKHYINGQNPGPNKFTLSDNLRYYPWGPDYLWLSTDTANRTMDGWIDEIRLYDRVLTEPEVQQNYAYVFNPGVEKQVNLITEKIKPLSPEAVITPPGKLYTLFNKSQSLIKASMRSRHRIYVLMSSKRLIDTDVDSHEEV